MEVTYINDIKKSPQDERQYRGLILPNQLRVLLVSDPETDISAAALSVGVGFLSDPDELQGLAHFCEHMLFLGSDKYPSENEYRKFLTEHGANHYNAFTKEDQTVYYFDIQAKHLGGGLDRFAQFFLGPLMSESAVNREVNAINSEHECNLGRDYSRIEQLRRSFSKNGHAYSKFNTGNKTTLADLPLEKGIDVRKELLHFHEKWYSANIMTLIVLGKECLEELEEMIVPLFSNVENNNVIRPEWPDHPYGPDQVGTKSYVVPVNDLKQLIIYFPIPDTCAYYKAKPFEYIADFIGHEGPESLLAALKARSWCNALETEIERTAKGFGFFVIDIDLTDEGVEKVDEIITLMFQYLNMLKECGIQEWIFEESRKITEINFRFQGKTDPEEYVSEIAENSQIYDYPMEDMLSGRYLIEEYRPDLIETLLSDYLKPSNVNVIVVGREFDLIADETESWYGTKYKLEKIPEELIEQWENCGINEELKLPTPNEFIPSNFDILFKEGKNTPPYPLIVHENPFLRVWLKQDDRFLLPKVNLKLEFLSPLAYFDPLSLNLTTIFVALLKDALSEYTFYASLAGLSCDLDERDSGFSLIISGYNDKQTVFLDKILEKMVELKIDPQRFNVIKEEYIRRLNKFDGYQPHERVYYNFRWLVLEKAWTFEERLLMAKHITIERLEEFIPKLLSKVYIECLIHGNVDEEGAKSLTEIMERRLISEKNLPVLPQEIFRNREVQLNKGEYLVLELPEKLHRSSCIDTCYQCCPLSTENNMLMQLLNQILDEACFDVLRTKEQLGYVVYCTFSKSASVQGLVITVQSEKHPRFLDQRIEAFLVHIREVMENMSEEEFERNKEALAAVRLEKPKQLSKLTGEFWGEISSEQYNFGRDEIEVAHLRTISKNDLLKFFDEYITMNAPKRRKLSVHIISQAEGGAGTLPQAEFSDTQPDATKITDIDKFKRSHGLWALTQPYVDIASFKAK